MQDRARRIPPISRISPCRGALLIALWLGSAVRAAGPFPPPAHRVALQTPASELAWLSGDWTGAARGERWEMHLTGRTGGIVLGTYKQYDPAGRLSFDELIRLDARPARPELALVPNGKAPVFYLLDAASSRDRHLVFRNEAHPFPREVAYDLEAEGTLRLRLEGQLNGRPFREEFPMRRRGLQRD